MALESLVRRQQQHRGRAESPLVRGFPRCLLQKTSLQTAIRYHEHSLLKGDGEKRGAFILVDQTWQWQ